MCFNPFQGFGGVSARSATGKRWTCSTFQSLSGFWWGFCLSRAAAWAEEGKRPFQSLSGFGWDFCRSWRYSSCVTRNAFQSLSGFWWGFCGPELDRLVAEQGDVSIPFRVLVGFLRGGKRLDPGGVPQVSIPFRVLTEFLPSKSLALRLARIAKDPVATAIRDTPRKGVIHLSKILLVPAYEDRVFPLRV